MASAEDMKKRIEELEAEVQRVKGESCAGAGRQKIAQMSSEVVDSNPYRLINVETITFISVMNLMP